jgi:arginine/lysine/ornithine decarboxylase
MAKLFGLAKLYSLAGFLALPLRGLWAFAELATPGYFKPQRHLNTKLCKLKIYSKQSLHKSSTALTQALYVNETNYLCQHGI